MKLYLMQHGNATPKEDHPERPLSEQGVRDVEKIATVLSRLELASTLSEIRHSGKRRAQETAEIVARALRSPQKVLATDGLQPNDDVLPVAATLQQDEKELLIVGHLPFLNRLANQLVTGNPETGPICFQQGGVLCLLRQEDAWKICWMLIPELL